MKLTDLRCFVEVAEAGNIARTALRQNVAQSGISRTINNLERKLNCRLFLRTGRGLTLTPAGDVFLNFAHMTLENFAQTQKQINRLHRQLPEKISLAIPLRLGRVLIPSLYAAFKHHMPDTQLQIYEEYTERMETGLAAGQFDIAISYADPDGTCQGEILEDLYAIARADKLPAGHDEITLADLNQLPLLAPGPSRYRNLLESAFNKAGQQLTVHRELEMSDALLAFAASGEGVAILSYANIGDEPSLNKLVVRKIVQPILQRSICFCFSRQLSFPAIKAAESSLYKAFTDTTETARWYPSQPMG